MLSVPRDGRAMETIEAELARVPNKRETLAAQGFLGGSGGGI